VYITFDSVNLQQLSGNTLKQFLFPICVLWRPLATHYSIAPQIQILILVLYKFVYLLNYLLTVHY